MILAVKVIGLVLLLLLLLLLLLSLLWRILIGPWWPAKAALVRNYLEVYLPCAGGLSAVNAIGTQLRDPINSGLTRWRMAVS